MVVNAQKMIWKICGMREPENISVVAELNPDFMGFIFFEKSPRNMQEQLLPKDLVDFPEEIEKVGVFVNADLDTILENVKNYSLAAVQLHGSESPAFCKELFDRHIKVIKAFSVDEQFDFEITTAYVEVTSLFLFDTKAPAGYGGHGKSFDWQLLENYTYSHPFLLAGGIGLENVQELKKLNHPSLKGFDLNSKFEISPALKDSELIAEFLQELKD